MKRIPGPTFKVVITVVQVEDHKVEVLGTVQEKKCH